MWQKMKRRLSSGWEQKGVGYPARKNPQNQELQKKQNSLKILKHRRFDHWKLIGWPSVAPSLAARGQVEGGRGQGAGEGDFGCLMFNF